jgi:hypothetical protein
MHSAVDDSMRLLFFARHWSYLRNFESAIEELARRGHVLHLAVDREEALGGRQMIERLVAKYPDRLTMGNAPVRGVDGWSELARKIRLGLDYLRFLEPAYADTPHLGDRARERAPRLLVRIADGPIGRTAGNRRLLGAVLRAVERGLPLDRELMQYIEAQHPDAVLITPLVDIGSPQLDHFAAARALGMRTVLPVGSWDHLSSKALLRSMPEAVVVWNDVQKQEAVELHGVPPERVHVTGAQCYDQWWGRAPSRSREAFCARVGLRPDAPFVLYVCSSLFRGTANEPAFVQEWIHALRSSADPRLRDLGILVRPHPARLDEWRGVDMSGYRNVAFWGAHPVDAESKDDYFDSMYYSAAVVGLNTSAFLEAACVGKPVHTVLDPQISTYNQEGTIHFRYLLNVNGGLLRVASSLDEHLTLLAGSLAGDGGGDPNAARFAQGFLRPFGLDAPATPRFADALERIVAAPPPRRQGGGTARLVGRVPLYAVAAVLALNARTQLWRKYTRNRWRKEFKAWKRRVLVDLKQFATRGLRKAPRPVVPPPPSALTPKLGRHRDPAKRLSGWDVEEAREVRELVTLLGRSGKPILVGPWLSETGFELLYWIPFLAWAKAYGNLDPEKLVVVSRGGAAPWYADLTPHYADVLSFYTPDEFRVKNEERILAQHGRMKHLDVSAFDREIIARVKEARGLHGAAMLHPSEMYRLFEHFWFQRAPVTLIEAFTHFAPLPAPSTPWALRASLPARYVAAKFYGNSALPDTPENRAFIASFLSELTEHTDVVLLNTGHRFDDHDDFPPSLKGRVHTIEHLMRPEDNLAVQTEVIRHAEAFIGTYGGFSYLAPLVGVDTLAFYSHPTGFRFDHLEVAKRVFSGLRCGNFVEIDVRALDVLRLGFGRRLDTVIGGR